MKLQRISQLINGNLLILGVFFFGILSCENQSKKENTINAIPIALKIERFDQKFGNASPENLPQIKSEFPYLFPKQIPDSIWIAKIGDSLQIELRQEVKKAFENFDQQETELNTLFKHIKYYFKTTKSPKVITLINNVDYNYRTSLNDSLLFIGLDNYLGSDHYFYEGISKYISKGLDQQFLISDVTSTFVKKVNVYPRNRTFLSRMVYYGKELFLKDSLMPDYKDHQKIKYLEDEIVWAQENEAQIWRYFIEKELLYSTKSDLDKRFLDPAPFSKFYLELDSESPGRLGRFIGWQIVRAYMDKTKVSLKELLNTPAEEIFKKSNYKPKK